MTTRVIHAWCAFCGWSGHPDDIISKRRWLGLSKTSDLLCPECSAYIGSKTSG